MKCTSMTKRNRSCNAFAVQGSDPPRCIVHLREAGSELGQGSTPGQWGFYGTTYTPAEIADLVSQTSPNDLQDEITAARVAIRRLLQQFQPEMDPVEYGKLARLVFTGANSVARLLRTQRVLSGDSADGIAGAIGRALDELSNEIGIDL